MNPSNSSSSKPAASIVADIRALDLDPIKVKLMDAEDGQGWTREYAERMEVAYKRFLTLLVTHPETTIAPTKEIDKFWHAHILDTMKYADDCLRVFGYFLHHFPYFGMRGAEDAAQFEKAGRETARLFAEEFNDTVPNAAAHCFAAVSGSESAHCFAAQPQAGSAHCFAAQPEASSAHCFAAQPHADTAHCFAAEPKIEAAHCFAAMTESMPMYGTAANTKDMTRPALALAA
jgi:hypothetical protein